MLYKEYCLDTVFTEFLADNNLNKKSQCSYKYALKQFLEKYPNYEDFTMENCKDYFDKLIEKKDLKKSTVIKKKKELSSFFNYVENKKEEFEGIPSDFENPIRFIKLAGEEKEEINVNKVIGLSELNNLLEYLQEHNKACMVAVILSFKLMLKTSEIARLKWKDIIEAEDKHFLAITNKGETRYLSMPEDVYERIMEYSDALINDGKDLSSYMFVDRKKCVQEKERKAISQRELQIWIKKAEEELGMDKYTYNDLRNSGITYAIRHKCPVEVIKEQIDLKTHTHIKRLSSAASISFTNAADYTHVVFTGGNGQK